MSRPQMFALINKETQDVVALSVNMAFPVEGQEVDESIPEELRFVIPEGAPRVTETTECVLVTNRDHSKINIGWIHVGNGVFQDPNTIEV